MNINALSPKLGICVDHDTGYVGGEQMDADSRRGGKIEGAGGRFNAATMEMVHRFRRLVRPINVGSKASDRLVQVATSPRVG